MSSKYFTQSQKLAILKSAASVGIKKAAEPLNNLPGISPLLPLPFMYNRKRIFPKSLIVKASPY